ncbi:hypothetical protein ASPVEDRAFT_80830 [Aspergillus versicolor CBS 583.65]|uniref:Zn(2)-C6 fungal-type domain-containing protein n=1 Tax=Aspergillus versicolor CBS 583.65 TaxID=1036611 RepID=A0A1L9PCK9_ASPVE|nr:uncharacterized protein ASPVEDRAFT_80830 [Aspergillus versicolor CBS 583.65]OJI99212.1 hypothetical protein ASPVEDRAFT_80830 [Aspergillus versicolor CBS 583.65]
MAAANGPEHSGLAPIAPAPTAQPGPDRGNSPISSDPMPSACQTCAKRKVKCDKTVPICARCWKSGRECVYQEPNSRHRKRKLSIDTLEKLGRLDRYERLLRQHGLLDAETSTSAKETRSVPFVEPGNSRTGKLFTRQGKSRYIDSHFWYSLDEDEMQHMSDEEDDETLRGGTGIPRSVVLDPLTAAAFMAPGQSLLQHHPNHKDAMVLWKIYTENVEPICKVLHIPSITKMVESVSQSPETASKPDECLLFAIYYVAVFSITDEECTDQFRQTRSTLMQRYHLAARQALVNASFLKTTEMAVLQAYYLFLLSSRHLYDPHTYYILTGVAVRIAQRMGLHQDGDKLELPPFEVEMRRRLFYQIFPLDGRASQSAGTAMMTLPESWDTKPPLNINDDQIWPGMTGKPVEQNGATEMIFCLSRACLGQKLARAGTPINGGAPLGFPDHHEAEKVISEAESEVEEKFIRYCDIVHPLHYLTIGLARSGITALRLKIRLPKIRNQTATDAERKEMFQLAQKTLDTDATVHSHIGISRYQWHVRPFFLWGTRDSFVFILTMLSNRRDLLSPVEVETAWKSVAQLYRNHDELFESKQALYVTLQRLALKAWDSYQLDSGVSEPAFIATLRNLRGAKENKQAERQESHCATSLLGPKGGTNIFTGLLEQPSSGIDSDLDFDVDDWVFWDQLMQDQLAQAT